MSNIDEEFRLYLARGSRIAETDNVGELEEPRIGYSDKYVVVAKDEEDCRRKLIRELSKGHVRYNKQGVELTELTRGAELPISLRLHILGEALPVIR